MEKNTKIIIGVTALIVVGGVILLVASNKKKQKVKECTDNGGVWDDTTKTCTDKNTDEVIDVSSGTSTSSSRPATGFLSKSEGDAFRLWVNTKYPLYAKSIFLDKSGDYDNSYIRKAYEKYGSEYKGVSTNPHLLAAKYLGANANILGDKTNVKFNGSKNTATFWSNGRFSTNLAGGSGYISKGNYLDGGKILVITEGANAGKTKKNGSVWTNLKSTL
jgi:hypothetical protein